MNQRHLGDPGVVAARAPGLPVNLLVTGRRCVVVGAGRVAWRKIESLTAAGAQVIVVAPDACTEVADAARRGTITWHARAFGPDDLRDAWLAYSATDDPEVNRQVFDAGEAYRVWVNAVDDPARCSFTSVSVLRRGDLVVTVGTQGRSPALAAYLRSLLEGEIGPEYGVLLELAAGARRALRESGRSSVDSDWRAAFDSGILDLIRAGRLSDAEELLRSCL